MTEKLYTEAELKQKLDEQRIQQNELHSRVMDAVVLGLASVIDSRDNNTGEHVRRTSKCVALFANKLIDNSDVEIDKTFANCIAKAAPLHDLGKLGIPDAVLQKPGRFTDEEYTIMKNHSMCGANLVYEVLSESRNISFIRIAINMAHYHHEKWDGSGYPEGLSGEDIPIESRIMALADVFDALVSKRCYKDSFSYDKAFQIIEESLGSHFDPKLGRAFLNCRKEIEELYDKLLLEDFNNLKVEE